MKESRINLLLRIGAGIAFLLLLTCPFINIKGTSVTILRLFYEDILGGQNIWTMQFFLSTIICACVSLYKNKTLKIISVIYMFIPFIGLTDLFERGIAELEFGAILYMSITIVMLIITLLPVEGEVEQKQNTSINSQKINVREYDENKLLEIIENSSLYVPSLVEQCRHEYELRNKSKVFIEQVSTFDINKIKEILDNKDIYAEELIYRCQIEYDERQHKQEKELAAKTETDHIEREKELERQRKEEEEEEKKNVLQDTKGK